MNNFTVKMRAPANFYLYTLPNYSLVVYHGYWLSFN